jgi:pimeloyl-ACP methyl ester carboxylesterase
VSSLSVGWLVALLAAACVLPGAAGAAVPSSKAVTFTVQNVNRSKLACSTDGATYQVKGHLVGPRSAPAGKKRRSRGAVTLYLHGLGFGEWFWRFTGAPGYDYATAQARIGHTSVVIDRLGYDASGHPEGSRSCLGGHADVAHQIVQQLRQGSYTVDAGKPKRFRKVALAGHSAGAEIANVAAYSFRDVDALILLSFSYSNLPRAQLALGPTRALCQAGGEPSEPGGPSGYAFFGQPAPGDFQSIMFAKTKASVLSAATALRNRDPCGDTDSIIRSLLQQRTFLPQIRVPVLVLCGTRDALYSALGCEQQKERYTRSRGAKLELVRGAGHALTLERTAPTVRKRLSRWLSKRGF